MDFESIKNISFSFQSFADLVFALVSLVFLIVSGILLFHWRKYGMKDKTIVMMEVLYVAVSVLLLTTAFFSVR